MIGVQDKRQEANGYQFVYDNENRIVEVLDASNTTVATFDYDALGRRIREKCKRPDLPPDLIHRFPNGLGGTE